MSRDVDKKNQERRSERRRRTLANESRRLGSGPVSQETPLVGPYSGGPRSNERVYFCRMGPRIKIGSTGATNSARLQNHEREARRWGGEFVVLAVVNGTASEERYIQNYFGDFRIEGEREFFELAEPLCEYIRWLRSFYWVAVGEDYRNGLPPDVRVMPFEAWRPEPSRRIQTSTPLFVGEFGRRVVTGDDYYTPGDLVQLIYDAFGGAIDLDPASHAVANELIGATRYFDKAEDGLLREWYGNVWLNPPFSAWPVWAEKVVTELDRGRINQLMALVSVPTLTARYIQPMLNRADLIILLPGRVDFWGPQVDNGNGAGASSGHVLVYFGKRTDEVKKVVQYLDAIVLRRTI